MVPADNAPLADACMACGSKCCKHGQIFMTPYDYRKVVAWLEAHAPGELAEFQSRCELSNHHGDLDFVLYDQLDGCQFLDAASLCRLHVDGAKPAECFWWPLHAYADGADVEVRVSSCCDAGKACEAPVVERVERDVRAVGLERIQRFRAVYPGAYDTVPVSRLTRR